MRITIITSDSRTPGPEHSPRMKILSLRLAIAGPPSLHISPYFGKRLISCVLLVKRLFDERRESTNTAVENTNDRERWLQKCLNFFWYFDSARTVTRARECRYYIV